MFTPEFFDTLILAVMIIGLALAVVRFQRDMTRPLQRRAGSVPASFSQADTASHPAVHADAVSDPIPPDTASTDDKPETGDSISSHGTD